MNPREVNAARSSTTRASRSAAQSLGKGDRGHEGSQENSEDKAAITDATEPLEATARVHDITVWICASRSLTSII
jgi:hypothetical protein